MKAVVFTLGCKVNSCESAVLLTLLKEKGYEVSSELGFADLYIINTCAVTSEAEKKSRQAVARVKKFNKNAKIIVTGCASQNCPSAFLEKEGVYLVTGTMQKQKIIDLLENSGVFISDTDDLSNSVIPENNDRTRTFIKIQDGCNNFCSYCIIPYLRGRSRSKTIKDILFELSNVKTQEVVLTAINLTAFNDNGKTLVDLINELSNFNFRIRLGSLEENIITEEFLIALSKLKDFAEHFHLSLQSGSQKVLKDMNRRYTPQEFYSSVKLIRKYFPLASITTDIIVGFPTESEENFNETINFSKNVEFSDIHPFIFSARKGTVAYNLKDLPSEVKKRRLDALIELKKQLKSSFIYKNLEKTNSVVCEEYVGDYTVGYTGNYLKAYIKGKIDLIKYKVKIIAPYNDGVLCEVIYE